MGLFDKIFGGKDGPAGWKLRRALKKVTQTHGDAGVRVGAMERLAEWRTPASIAALLRRFTVQASQGSVDLEEKQYTVRLLTDIGEPAVQPILAYLRTESEVTWPARALREILPPDRFHLAMRELLESLAAGYSRWPEAKAVLIQLLPDAAFPEMRETLLRFLNDEDDDVCIAAADYLVRNGDEEIRDNLLQTLLNSQARPRVLGRILDHFCEQDWPVKGYKKQVEEMIPEPFYLTSKGSVKRRPR